MDFTAARKVMLDTQVRVNDVTDRELQAAIGAVERERFCAPDRVFSAYADVEPEIAGNRRLMLPRDVAKLLQGVDARAGDPMDQDMSALLPTSARPDGFSSQR